MKTKTLRLRDLKIMDVFQFADDKQNLKFMGYTLTLFMDDITGYEHNYVTYNTINRKKGVITGRGYYRGDNPEVILIGNAREMWPQRFARWYEWREQPPHTENKKAIPAF